MSIQKVAVIGSGVMGSGIAAQVANAGIPVVLLDIVPQGATDRSVLAKTAIEKALKADPAPFMQKRNAKLITPGNLEDDLNLLADCDWIIEVVLEDLAVKHTTYAKINSVRKKGSVVSSNTSTIPLEKLVEGLGDDFASDFMITHFFNPPRYMRLLEVVIGKKTRADAAQMIVNFCDINLGKGVVKCNDTPGFIGNRLGVFWLTAGINEAINYDVTAEEADAIMSKPLGFPKTGIFGLVDLVGIDLMPHLSKSLLSTLPADDEYRKVFKDYGFIHGMIAAGYTGRKGKGGFYRLNPENPKAKEKQVLSVQADQFEEVQYVKAVKPKPKAASAGKEGMRAVVETPDAGGQYAWAVISQTLAYAASLVPEIADDITKVDEAMRLGYNWKFGPFEMIDKLGAAWFAQKLQSEGRAVPKLLADVGEGSFYRIENGKTQYFGTDGKYHDLKRADGVLLLSDLKLSQKPILKNGSASVWDIGEGVLCFEKHSKMNTFDEQIFALLNQTIDKIGDGKGEYKGLVIYNEATHFSAGANLGLALFLINIGMWNQVEEFIAAGQKTYMRLKYSPFPVVAAPSGMALGGGCEILLHADKVQAHAETYCGLVEVGVGLIPAWGGCKEMILRFRERQAAKTKRMWMSPANDPMGAVRSAFEVIGVATVAKSAQEAKAIGYLRDSDGITMNRDRLLFDAKSSVLEMAKDYVQKEPVVDIRLPGAAGEVALDMAVSDLQKAGKATPYDGVVSGRLAAVLSGGKKADWTKPVSEEDIVRMEREEFMHLLHQDGTLARIEHMLDKGKPLRN
jgi:3-hydroxyacyl-CoA dehydrogenase